MGLFRRRKQKPGVVRRASTEDFAHLEEFARTRRGVEAYVEPRTTVTEMTVALVAHDGEWTRRRVDGPEAARALGQRLSIPVYDVGAVGYPRRMREWTSRQRAGGKSDHGGPSG
ncbi:MAG TPA: oxidoreductase [Mycobacteriales bacterium]